MVQNTPADWQGDYVSFHRNNRTRDFTVMGNIHLRDKNLSLKAVGLLSKMLSFNDSWQFSTRGLAAICKEGPDAILSTLKELEENGYLVRHRSRDDIVLLSPKTWNAAVRLRRQSVLTTETIGWMRMLP